MAKAIGIDAVRGALGRVKYPGYATDIVTFGMIDDISAAADGAITVTLRQATESEDVLRQVARQIHHALSHELGLERVEIKARRLEPELGEKTGRVRLEGTRYVIAVASGKGGVGKSTVAANLAVALHQLGLSVGLLDADIYGPSMAMMFGTGDARPRAADKTRFHPVEKYGIKLISMAFFLTDKAPVIWRGPMVMGAVRQFLKDTVWGTQDFLIVDLPPGTGDAQLTLAQQVALDGVVVVTTPQDVAVLDAVRAVRMFNQVHCPVLGIVENMSLFVCPDCGEEEEIFGRGGGERMAAEQGTTVLGRIPIYPEIRQSGDGGMPIVMASPEHPASRIFIEVARQIVGLMPD
ncbi:MAG TPA: Mrp/NBP35 family ATP-binding protein [Candidatus Binataceae bacterium]